MDKDVQNTISKLREARKAQSSPTWLSTDEKGKRHVSEIPLATELEQRYQFMINQFSESGYWYNPETKQWGLHADSVIPMKVKDAIKNNGIWNTGLLSSVSKLIDLDSRRIVNEDPFDNPAPHKAVFGKHTYNLDTDKLEENDPANYILASRDYELNIDGSAPTWNEWLKQSLVSTSNYQETEDGKLKDEYDIKAVETLKAFIGYALIGSHKEFQHYLMLYGHGGDGKSTLLNWISKIIDGRNVSNIPLEDLSDSKEAKFATSKLYQKQANIFADISPKFMNQTNIIKVLTGGDKINAQFKYQDPFEFYNEAKLIFSCNELPAFNDFSEGMTRRPIIITFHKIKDFKDKFSNEKLEKELPAFTYECLRSYKKALDDKESNNGYLPTTEYMRQQRKSWIDANDNIRSWINECCETGSNKKEKGVYLYDNYKEYCQQMGGHELSKKKFIEALENRGYEYTTIREQVGSNPVKGFKGIQNK